MNKDFLILGVHENNTLEQFHEVSVDTEYSVLCADGHYGYIAPVGSVLAYKNAILPAGVGYDIGCGNMAVKLDLEPGHPAMTRDLGKTLDWIQENIPFGIGRARSQTEMADSWIFDDPKLWLAYDKHERDELFKLARKQLGTVGSGNHYVDLFIDKHENYWIGVHFGSRGLGHKTATGFMNLGINGKWDKRAPEQYCLLELGYELGERYWAAMELCGFYAYAGREDVVKRIAEYLGAGVLDTVHNHHNFAWLENHHGEKLIVVRKGATPLKPDQRGFVGGSMGDHSYILKGIESKKSREILCSTIHGAGRVMGRMRAKGKFHRKTGEMLREPEVKREWMDEWIRDFKVELRGGDVDESPHCYKRIDEVIQYHEGTFEIETKLRPIGVVMAGQDIRDPYKD